jgi:hypothetical protein
MTVQTNFFPMIDVVEILATDSENEIEARWHSVTGAIAIVDIESGYVINDAYPIIKDRLAAIAKAKLMLGIA